MKFIPKFLALFLCLTSPVLAKVNIDTLEGNLPRDLSDGSFTITISFSGVGDKPDSGSYSHDLEVYVTDDNSNNFLPFTNADPGENKNNTNFIIDAPNEEVTTEDNGNVKVSVTLTIREQSEGKLESAVGDDNKIKVNVDHSSDDAESKSIELTKDSALAKQKPEGVTFKGGHLKVTARWTAEESINYSKGDPQAPQGMLLFVAPAGSGVLNLPALKHDPDKDEDTEEKTCTFNTDADDDTDCVVCDNNAGADDIYVKRGDLPDEVKYASVGKDAEKVSVTGLEDVDAAGNALTYIGFISFRPDGLLRSKCRTSVPNRNLTWSEFLDDTEEAKRQNPACFIATAAYGSALHRDIDELRWLRDTYLKKSYLGSKFVKLYYRYSPPVAEFVRQRPWLAKIVRSVLEPTVKAVRSFRGERTLR